MAATHLTATVRRTPRRGRLGLGHARAEQVRRRRRRGPEAGRQLASVCSVPNTRCNAALFLNLHTPHHTGAPPASAAPERKIFELGPAGRVWTLEWKPGSPGVVEDRIAVSLVYTVVDAVCLCMRLGLGFGHGQGICACCWLLWEIVSYMYRGEIDQVF